MENLNMSSTSNVESLRVIVEALTTLQSADRLRVVRAALELLGESSGDVGARGDTPGKSGADPLANEINATRLSPRARAWMKQFSITQSDLESSTSRKMELSSYRLSFPEKTRRNKLTAPIS
jgi:hypothetical protein